MTDSSRGLRTWFRERLSHFLGFPSGEELVDEELVDYILTQEDAGDVKEYLSNLLDINDAETRLFVDEFFRRWSNSSKRIHAAETINKSEGEEESVKEITNLSKQGIHVSMCELGGNGHKRPIRTTTDVAHRNQRPFRLNHLSMDSYSRNDDAGFTMLPGRHACPCLAQKHQLINNCIQCGRIVCEQEGCGPCMFCGNLVAYPDDIEMINRESKKGNKLKKKLLAQIVPNCENSLQKAIEHKEELLYFDRNPAERIKVIDAEADYLSADKKSMNRKRKNNLAKEESSEKLLSKSDHKFGRENMKRLQDKEIQEMADQGICLSVDQPWASLLVHGIRKIEKRNWYTSHRGRVWIASTHKVPEIEFVSQIESQCRNILDDIDMKFPTTYPTGVLLGCANLVDCCASNEYGTEDNFEEENCPQYLLYFDNPEQISLKLPIKGYRKMYRLEGHIHTAAKDMLIMT